MSEGAQTSTLGLISWWWCRLHPLTSPLSTRVKPWGRFWWIVTMGTSSLGPEETVWQRSAMVRSPLEQKGNLEQVPVCLCISVSLDKFVRTGWISQYLRVLKFSNQGDESWLVSSPRLENRNEFLPVHVCVCLPAPTMSAIKTLDPGSVPQHLSTLLWMSQAVLLPGDQRDELLIRMFRGVWTPAPTAREWPSG